MVEYTPANYVLLGASVIVFSAMFIGCIILVAKEKQRWDSKKRERRRQNYYNFRQEQRRVAARESPEPEHETPSTVASPAPSMVVSLRGINEWHLLPPIKESYRPSNEYQYTVETCDSDRGYRSTMA